MQHAERLCDRLLLLKKGRKCFEGTLAQARAQLPARLTVVAKADLSGLPGVRGATAAPAADQDWREWSLQLETGVDPGELLEQCSSRGLALRRWDHHQASLHEVFVQLVGAGEIEP
jgi:ABC-2 type transport system ATP-binding protein